ncbi:hypothetical protein ACFYVL_22210 [Streptomyces sp. NPDC004111]|uniref:hypothetical protein n=1 Tax=Streptomyces sp. NPDC004111 TaxID=3364690 RepID=UPI0036C43405
MSGRPGAGNGPTADAAGDWQEEWRWHDARWATATMVVVVGGCAGGVLWWVTGSGPRVAVVALVASALLAWANSRSMTYLQNRTGCTYRQLAALMRLARQERIPEDPAARRGMLALVRFQNSKKAGGAWAQPVSVGAVLVLAAVQLLGGHFLLGALLVAGAGLLASKLSPLARTRARLARLEAALTGS